MTGKKVIVDGRVVEVWVRLGRRFALNTDRLPEFLAGQEIPTTGLLASRRSSATSLTTSCKRRERAEFSQGPARCPSWRLR